MRRLGLAVLLLCLPVAGPLPAQDKALADAVGEASADLPTESAEGRISVADAAKIVAQARGQGTASGSDGAVAGSDLVQDLRFLFKEFYPEDGPDTAARAEVRAAFTRVFVDSYAPAIAAQLDYNGQSVGHRGRTFEWQLLSSKIIFFTVIGLVGIGVIFSGWQFYMAMTQAATLPKGKEMTGSGTQSSLELSPAGLKVTSNVLGVILLALSLAFFYLYLEHVYEIREIGPSPALAVSP